MGRTSDYFRSNSGSNRGDRVTDSKRGPRASLISDGAIIVHVPPPGVYYSSPKTGYVDRKE
jgi:hypothetical protein